MLRRAVALGEAEAHQVARLTDRLLMAERREQLYGTILLPRQGELAPFRLADPESVDERRRVLGLPPLAEDILSRSQGVRP